MTDATLTLVETGAEVRAFWDWLGQRRPWLAVDTETGGFEWWRQPLRLVQIGDAQAAWAFDWRMWAGVVKEAIEVYSGPMAMHNVKFDLHFLETNRVKVPRLNLHDTLSMVTVVEPHLPGALKRAADRHIDGRSDFLQTELNRGMMRHHWTIGTTPIDFPPFWQYACLDAVLTARLAELFWPQVQAFFPRVYDVELNSALVLTDVERRGMRVDLEYCGRQREALERYLETLEEWCEENYHVRPSADRAVIGRLQGDGVALTQRTEKGQIALTAEVLEPLGHPLAVAVGRYRKAKKNLDYFVDFVTFSDRDGFVHPSFNVSGARTGRMSCERPNLQNVPRSQLVRQAFIPREGHKLVLADYDQIEMRLMAHAAREQSMIDAVHGGVDLHTAMTRIVYAIPDDQQVPKEKRTIMKGANFAKIYGAGPAKFALTAGITLDQARHFLDLYDARFPGIRQFQASVQTQVQGLAAAAPDHLAHVITEYLGRQQVVAPDKAYKLINYIIQGTAADVLKLKMVEESMTPLGDHLVVLIHDELGHDVPEDEVEDLVAKLPEVIEERTAFSVPLTVGIDVVSNWGEKYA